MSQFRIDTFLQIQRIHFKLNRARHLLTAEMDVELDGTGVSSSHVGALLLLYMGMVRTSAGLSRQLGVDPGFVTRLIDQLEKEGLVRRDRNRPDRRVVNLTLTESGRNLASRIKEIAPRILNRRLAGFTDLDFATLCGLLHKLLNE